MEEPMFINFTEKFKKLITPPILKSEGGQVLRKVENGWVIENDQPTTKLILSGDLLEKGKAGQVGEIREWSGVKYKKVQSGKWAPVTENKSKKGEETSKGEGRKSEGVGVDFSSFSDEKLKKYARSANSQALKKHAEGSDEKVRVIAKEELSRREKEENPDYEAPKEEVEKGKEKKETKAKGTTDKKDTKTGSKVKEKEEKPKEVKGEVSLYDKEWNDLNSADFNQLLKDHSDYVEAKGGNIKAPIKDFFDRKGKSSSGEALQNRKKEIKPLIEEGFFGTYSEDGGDIDSKGLDEVDRALLFSYSTEDYYHFNKSLREVPPSEKAVKLNDQLNSTLEKLQGDSGEFYRGASFSTTEKYIDFLGTMDEQIKSQGFFQFKTPTSSSKSGTVAKDFSRLYPNRPHLIFMNIVSKGGAKNITDYTEVPEGEYLFSSNCKFKLSEIKVSGRSVTMDIEEL